MDTDVVVIGAGIAGAAAVWSLAQHMRVILVEREQQAGHHATSRSASVLSETSGHPVVCALARAGRAFFESPPNGFCESPLLSPRGLLWVGRAEQSSLLETFFTASQQVAPGTLRLDAGQTARLLPGFRAEAIAGGSVHEPQAMAIDTAALLNSYVSGARRRGAAVIMSADVSGSLRTPSGWVVTAGDAVIETTHVVNAAGAWGDVVAERCGVGAIGLRPLRRTAAVIPAPDWVRSWPLVMDIGGHYYVEPDSAGLLVSPADETESEPCDARPDELDVAIALERVGAATEVPIRSVRSAWAGLRTFARDRAPVLGQEPGTPGFWWLVGQGGGGIKTAPAMAALLTAHMIGGSVGSTDEALTAAMAADRFR